MIAPYNPHAHAARIDARHGDGNTWMDGDYRTAGTIGAAMRPLTDEQLRKCAPSIFAEAAHSRTSQRYSFLPTSAILLGMAEEGWVPTLAQEQKVRDESREGFQRHMIRFTHRDDLQKRSMERPEIVLINAHDRSSAYHLHAGIFRAYCLNGLVVCDATFEQQSITHMDFEPAKVIEASVRISRSVPALMDGIAEMKAVQLSQPERVAFAQAACLARWEDLDKAPVRPDRLLVPKRSEDAAPTLWNTLNTVQERLIKGGDRDGAKRRKDGAKMGKVRAVNGIDGDVSLNKALWTLAEEMKRLKAQA